MTRFFGPSAGGTGGSAAVFNPGSTVLASGGAGGRRMLQQGVSSSGAVVPQTTSATSGGLAGTGTGAYAAAPSSGIVSGAGGYYAAAPAPSAAAGCRTVAQIIQQTPNLSVLRSLLPLLPADLRAYLTRAAGSQFTIFAPSDAAWQLAVIQIPDFAVVLDPSLLLNAARGALGNGQPDARALTALFAYHIVPNVAATSQQLQNGQVLPTALKGASLRVSIAQPGAASASSSMAGAPAAAASTGVEIKGVGSTAAVTQPDIQACRGVVHIIDSVLLPVSLQGIMSGGAPAQAAGGGG